jgi:hypothetical protein
MRTTAHATRVFLEKEGRTFRVMAGNEAGDRFCLMKSRDRSWVRSYIGNLEYFFRYEVDNKDLLR